MKTLIRQMSSQIAPWAILLLVSSTGLLAKENWTSPEVLTSKPAPWIGETLWGTQCHEKSVIQGVGPVDYNRRGEWFKAELVEQQHFFPEVEHLQFGYRVGSKSLTAGIEDIDYTLRAFPNHHRALYSIITLRLDDRYDVKNLQFPPAECYLQRAVNFTPNDGVVYMLYGLLLHRMIILDKALPLYEKAEQLRPKDPQVKYNMGLLLVDLDRYEDALVYANMVYSKNFPMQGLRRKLAEKGFQVNGSKPG